MNVVAVPGPCAAIAALSIGALPTDRFCFEGFLPARGAARKLRLKALETEPRTLVIYESPHRVRETLEDCATVFGESRAATVVREATKLHETTYRGSLRELLDKSGADADFSRGEIVLLICGASQTECRRRRGNGQIAAGQGADGAAGRVAPETSGASRGADHRARATMRLISARCSSKSNPPRINARDLRMVHTESARQSLSLPGKAWRKVRAPQGTVPGNAWEARAYGKCNRKIPPKCRASGAGKGEMVR